MRRLKRNAILEIYQLVLALFLFVSPWLFAFAHGTLRIDTWVSAALVAIVSFIALVAFRDWENGSIVSSVCGLRCHRGYSAFSTPQRWLLTWLLVF
jgi:hypothetical protein